MKIVFIASKCLPFHAHSLEEKPLGGTETAVIRLAYELHERGHEISVYTAHDNPPPSQPGYFRLNALQREKNVDAIISVRDWVPLLVALPSRKRFFWTGDSFDQIQNFGIGDRRIAGRIDAFLAVSAWQAATLCAQSGFPLEKAWVLRNGVHLPYFDGSETRARKRLIYASTPYRGLALVPALFRALKDRHPQAELHVYSGFEVYGGASVYDPRVVRQFEAIKAELEKQPGCHLHGNLLQKELAREFMKSSLLFYPNVFAETSCIVAMEAQAAGCAIVTSDYGALRETVGDAGVVIKGRPGSDEYNREFIEAASRILSDDAYFSALSQAGLKRAAELFSWKVIAQRFEEYLVKGHGLGRS